MEGWIKIHRRIQDHWIWQDPVKLKWWIDILLTVNHKPVKINIGYELVECDRGQSIMSLSGWADRWGVSRHTVRNFFDLLSKDGMISRKTYAKTTQVTVCKYDEYQLLLRNEGQMRDGLRTDEGQMRDTNKKEKKEKNDKNDKETIVEKSTAFKICTDIYFEVYEKKTGLKPAFSGAEGKHLKELIEKIKNSIIQKEGQAPDEKIQDAFKYILNHLPKFYQDKIDLKIINSKYDGIIAEIRSKSGGSLEDKVQDIISRHNSR